MSLSLQYQANILDRIIVRWIMRLEIVNALLLGEVASPKTTMEKSIGNEEGSLIPRGRETPDRIQGHKLRENEAPRTMNMTIEVLIYTSCKWIVDPDPIKVPKKTFD
mgnify:FL=1